MSHPSGGAIASLTTTWMGLHELHVTGTDGVPGWCFRNAKDPPGGDAEVPEWPENATAASSTSMTVSTRNSPLAVDRSRFCPGTSSHMTRRIRRRRRRARPNVNRSHSSPECTGK